MQPPKPRFGCIFTWKSQPNHGFGPPAAAKPCILHVFGASGDRLFKKFSPRSSVFAPPCSLASLLAPRSSLALLFSPRGTSSFVFLLALPLPRLSQGPPNDLTTRPCCEQSLCKPAAQYREGPVQLNCVISAATDRGSINSLIN